MSHYEADWLKLRENQYKEALERETTRCTRNMSEDQAREQNTNPTKLIDLLQDIHSRLPEQVREQNNEGDTIGGDCEEQAKIAASVVNYGQGFSMNGKHIKNEDVYKDDCEKEDCPEQASKFTVDDMYDREYSVGKQKEALDEMADRNERQATEIEKFWQAEKEKEALDKTVGSRDVPKIVEGGELPEHYKDAVQHPNHYKVIDLECIEMIAGCLTVEAFKGYCLGCWMKYRFRAGNKGDVQQDIDKSEKYTSLFEDYKHLCKAPF